MENGKCNGSSTTKCNGAAAAAMHVAMLVTPGMGHLIPLAELAKRLAARHGVTSTLLTFASTASATQREFLALLPPAIESVSLPPVDLSDLPADAAIETLMSEECVRLVPALTAILSGIRERRRLVAFVADLFGADSFDAARDAGVPRRYLFFPTNLHALTLLLHLPDLDVSIPGEFRDLDEPVRLPGCVPIPGKDILMPLQDKSRACYGWMVHHGTRYRDADAILVNSFDAVEPDAARVLRHPKPGVPPEHMRELALGLELSGQRFLWVVRSPSDEGEVSANYYDAETKKNPFGYLPEGFVERTKEVGLLVPSWAPQTKVLAHRATGGFLTHCGWNSVLESLVHGVPMVAWPLFAEQRQNAVMLTEGAGAAIRVPESKGKEKIAAVVREMMVGEGRGAAVRAKVAELQKMATDGLRDGGAATSALDEVVDKWTGGEK
uniref:Glycosyltransferase n=1 Tax=Oryza barthii TaxID=65489 RepID=A0A0D3HNP7_9ORYZ